MFLNNQIAGQSCDGCIGFFQELCQLFQHISGNKRDLIKARRLLGLALVCDNQLPYFFDCLPAKLFVPLELLEVLLDCVLIVLQNCLLKKLQLFKPRQAQRSHLLLEPPETAV